MSDERKRKAVFEYHRSNSDMLIILEAHCSTEVEKIWESQWGGKAYFSHGTAAARGVAIFVKKELVGNISNVYLGEDGRTIILDYNENDKNITLAAIYAPNNDDPKYFTTICKLLEERQESKVIVGDYNLVLDVEMDRLNTYCNNNKAMKQVEEMMEQYSLKDVWRIQNPLSRKYSWYKRGNLMKASRIDFALVSAGLDQKVKEIQYLSSIKMDHRAIYMVIDVHYIDRGTGYWKLNNTLLKDHDFVQTMNKELESTKQSLEGKGKCESWEILKQRIKKVSSQFARKKCRENNLVIGVLAEKVNEYEENMPLSREDDQLLEETKMDLEDKMMEKAQGMMFRTKLKWYEEGEKNTKYFFQLEKTKYNAKTCFKVITEEGREICNQQEILEEQRKFYAELYDIDRDVVFSVQNDFGVVVPENIKEVQEQNLTLKDIEEAIKGMNNNKTPGKDGIPVDFYKVFWSRLKEPFISMMEECYQNMYLHTSARQGVLNLIPKVNKDTRRIKNLRPITLLNTDYKIIEKAVANKMIPALPCIIHQDQRGFMKERRISVNIRKILDIMYQAKKEDLEAVILSLDFVKCFDKCSFSILHGSLDFFQFGQVVKDWTKILYKDYTVEIQNNGFFSKKIPIKKGVHQGGCCSSVYFLVIAEILALALRRNENIEGFTMKDIKNILNQFADDMDLPSLCSERSLSAIFEELEKFKKHSGFTISYDKTTMYRIGSLRHSDATLYNMSQVAWTSQDINILGVTIAHEDIIEKNYVPLLDKI